MRTLEQHMKKFLSNINPSQTYVDRAISEHKTLRGHIEESDILSEYRPTTFLQGSYRKNTAIEMIKDVDVVCLFTGEYYYFAPGEIVNNPFTPEKVYTLLYSALSSMPMYKDKLRPQKRSIGIEMGIQLDVIPAIAGPPGIDADPIRIPEKGSDGNMRWVDTYTRTDIGLCSEKNSRCDNNFVPIVKMLKYWRNVRLSKSQTPCSYFLETLLHRVPDDIYSGSIAPAFVGVCMWIVKNITPKFAGSVGLLMTGGDNLFSSSNWSLLNYSIFYDQLMRDTYALAIGLNKETDDDATEEWRSVFGQKFLKDI